MENYTSIKMFQSVQIINFVCNKYWDLYEVIYAKKITT